MTNYGLGRILFNSLSHIMSELVHKFPHTCYGLFYFSKVRRRCPIYVLFYLPVTIKLADFVPCTLQVT